MAGESALTYRSKIDGWHVLFTLALFLQGFVMLRVYDPLPPPVYSYGGWLLVAIGVLAVSCMLTTTYKITETELLVRFLMIPMRIPLKGIERVAEKRGSAVRFGCSRDALEVKYRTDSTIGSVVISPKQKDAFLQELTKAMARAAAPCGSFVAGS